MNDIMANKRDLGWITGILEAEGCFRLHSDKTYRRAAMSMTSTDEDVVRRLAALMGIGSVDGPVVRDPKHKPQWRWRVSGSAATEAMRVLQPYMSDRRRQRIGEVLATANAERMRAKEVLRRVGAAAYVRNLNTPEGQRKRAAGCVGRVMTLETRAKISAARKAGEEAKRARRMSRE